MMNTTHIGSLPFKTTQEAIAFNKEFSLPVLSTLPHINKNEYIIDQVLAGIKGYSYENLKITLDEDFTLEEFKFPFTLEKEFIDSFSNKAIKWQIVGIVTLLKTVSNLDESKALKIIDWHAKNIASYHKFLQNNFVDVLFFLDEPMYNSVEDKLVLQMFLEQLFRYNVESSMHCCGEIRLEHYLDLKLNGLSFDLGQLKHNTISELQDVIKKLYLGVIDTIEMSCDLELKQNSEHFYTPACGLAFSDPVKVLNIPNILKSRTV